MKIKLCPFIIPNFFHAEMPPWRRQDGLRPVPVWGINEVEAADIAELCDQFRAGLFAKAGKPDPAVPASAVTEVSEARIEAGFKAWNDYMNAIPKWQNHDATDQNEALRAALVAAFGKAKS